MSDAPLLETRALTKRFGGLIATDEVSITLAAGEVHALIGPNGAGKTTLIGLLCGEQMPDSGQVLIAGVDATRMPVQRRARLGLGRSYQITQVCREFSVIENVMLAAMAVGEIGGAGFGIWRPFRRETGLEQRARDSLARVGIAALADTPVDRLAHGQHRQLELAMALALRPKILLLDEPLAGMSSAESAQMIELLQSLRPHYPMLLVEHDMNAVFALADRISVLVYGKVISSGSVRQVRDDPLVRAAYLGETAGDTPADTARQPGRTS